MSTAHPKEISALLRTGLASSEPVTEVPLAEGGVLRYRKDVTSSISGQIEAVPGDGVPSVLLRRFRASASRPPEYPTAAPFLADCIVTVTETPDHVVLAWEQVPQLDAALASLVEDSLRDGWVEEPKPGSQGFSQFMGMQMRTFQRGVRQRVFSAMTWPAPILSCVEGRKTPTPVEAPR